MRVVDVFLFDHVCDTGGDGRGLARACACEDQLGTLVCFMASSWRGFRVERRESKEIDTTVQSPVK